MTPEERLTYTERQSLKGKMTHARIRLIEAARDQRHPSKELVQAIQEYDRLEAQIRRLG